MKTDVSLTQEEIAALGQLVQASLLAVPEALRTSPTRELKVLLRLTRVLQAAQRKLEGPETKESGRMLRGTKHRERMRRTM
jgi:hypothetical protein